MRAVQLVGRTTINISVHTVDVYIITLSSRQMQMHPSTAGFRTRSHQPRALRSRGGDEREREKSSSMRAA